MLNFNIIDNGKKEFVVFIHGLGGSTVTWKKQIEDFSRDYNLVLIDMPGHGENRDSVIESINFEELSDEIAEILIDNKVDSAYFIGMSLGSIIIAHFADKYKSKVKGVVFAGSVIAVSDNYRFLMHLTQAVKRFIPFKMLYNCISLVLMPKNNHKKSRTIFKREAYKMNRTSFMSWADTLKESLSPEKMIEALNRAGLNMLFISGEEDCAFIGGTKKLVTKLKNATFEQIEKCGHVCTIEKYREFNQMALEFLKSGNTVENI